MTLDEWLEADGRGAIHRLHLRAGVSLPVIARARDGRANLSNATKIHDAVHRLVPISSMTADEVPAALEPRRPTRAARASAQRGRPARKRVA